jgi:MFS family permease
VILRFIQGLSLGGEFGGGITLTAEFAPAERRGFYVGLVQSAQGLGPLMATLLIFILSSIMGQAQYNSIGWRILFIFGSIIAVIGVYIRLRISESPVFREIKERGQISRIPIAEAFKKYPRQILIGLGFIIGGTTMTYVTGVFASSYLQNVVGFSASTASLILSIGYTVLALLSPLFGALSDKIGRKPLMVIEAIGLVVLVYPYFILLSSKNFEYAVIAQVLAQAIFSIANGAYAAALTEMFTTKVRYTALSFDYHVGVAAFGGTTPFIATYLIYITKNILSPTYWGISGMLITLIAYLLYRETKGIKFSA